MSPQLPQAGKIKFQILNICINWISDQYNHHRSVSFYKFDSEDDEDIDIDIDIEDDEDIDIDIDIEDDEDIDANGNLSQFNCDRINCGGKYDSARSELERYALEH